MAKIELTDAEKREVLECLEKGRPQEVQSRIFRKSFSTKSRDRGIGTYSIKLFTEKYLKGKVWFTSTPEQGTTFYIRIPNSNGTG